MSAVNYIPILTTAFTVFFSYQLFQHWNRRGYAPHLGWWLTGVICYGAGTFVESWVTLNGWSPFAFKSWYILGALLGGAPLAQGSVHLHMKATTARILDFVLSVTIIITSLLVVMSPLDLQWMEPGQLSGKVLSWSWIRLITPFINTYAFIFLVGGAIYSAWYYYKHKESKARMQGNIWIAVGGLLPGIGGAFSKSGYTEVLYVAEFIGILLIYQGYRIIRKENTVST